jgi:hypothetical protein
MGIAILFLIATNYYMNKRLNSERQILEIYTESLMDEQRSITYKCDEILKILEETRS